MSSKRVSSSLIDVILSNGNSIVDLSVHKCPFSDHSFVIATCNIPKEKSKPIYKTTRNLSNTNLEKINELLANTDFSQLNFFDNINDRWCVFRKLVMDIVDQIAPFKTKTLKSKNYPWFDDELRSSRETRDLFFKNAIKSKLSCDWLKYKESRSSFQSLYRRKMKEYFENKNQSNFKNAKQYWNFYSSFVNIKSSVEHSTVNSIKFNNSAVFDKKDIGNGFNSFFTSLEAQSNSNISDSLEFIDKNLLNLRRKIKMFDNIKSDGHFKFKPTCIDEVKTIIDNLQSSSSPGISQIPTVVLKFSAPILSKILVDFINHAIINCEIPNEWKIAIVSPLYKNKGDKSDPNNYRAISILPPIAKLFEKVIAKQITAYFEVNKIFAEDQHGFRRTHSCESALHSIISKCFENLDKKLINLLLFIDFRKAFDLLNRNLLFRKLFCYGFDNKSLTLIKNYFNGRYQLTKIDDFLSDPISITLGVPQGSILGPLFFLIFINDLSLFIESFVKLFADDTTVLSSSDDQQII
jgi:hypothetical protein